MKILEEEDELKEIVRLVGMDALSQSERLLLEVARSVREDFLHQNAFHEIDTYTSIEKQYKMLRAILYFYDKAQEALKDGVTIEGISKLKVLERMARAKYVGEDKLDNIEKIEKEIDEEIKALSTKAE